MKPGEVETAEVELTGLVGALWDAGRRLRGRREDGLAQGELEDGWRWDEGADREDSTGEPTALRLAAAEPDGARRYVGPGMVLHAVPHPTTGWHVTVEGLAAVEVAGEVVRAGSWSRVETLPEPMCVTVGGRTIWLERG